MAISSAFLRKKLGLITAQELVITPSVFSARLRRKVLGISPGFAEQLFLMFKVDKNISLAKFSNYKIGGPATYFFAPKNDREIKEAVEWAKKEKQKIFILGGGTNLLISDAGFSGFVLKPSFEHLKLKGNKIEVGSGVLVSDLLKFASQKGLAGVEWAGGLPGTVGGAIYGNAGAFGGEMKDSIESVDSFNIKKMEKISRTNKECRFDYRSSIFKEKRGEEIVLSAVFNLKPSERKKIESSIAEKVKYREDHQPLEYPNVGSIFKNVDVNKFKKVELAKMLHVIKTDPFPVVPAAHLISEVGLKGVSYGGAMISPKHPNFIVNTGAASANDVLALIGLVKSEVKKEFKVNLEEEVQIIV